MNQRIFHGTITPDDIADSLLIHFNRTNLEAQKFYISNQTAVQIRSRQLRESGGDTAISVMIQTVEDGISVQIGQQAWFGLFASLGVSALRTLINPVQLMGRLDDIAQDVENFQLQDEIWKVIESNARALGAGFELSDRLRRIVCEYCNSANPVGEPACVACGAPLGKQQPHTCSQCGFVLRTKASICPNCGKRNY